MLRKGSTNISTLVDSVRKWDGLDSTLGREEMYVNLIALPILAWFFKPNADMSVAMIEAPAATSMALADTASSSWECGW